MANGNVLKRQFVHRNELQHYLREQFPTASSLGGYLSPVHGGYAAAQRKLGDFNPSAYAATRNFLSGSVSGLSCYIRHGVLTLREVLGNVVKKSGGVKHAYKFIQELAWRDYWQRLYFAWGDGIWIDREEWKTGFHASDYADDIPADLATGSTQLACMDGFSQTLQNEGHLHNHARMWLAAYVVHWRRVKWQAAARWFLTHLLDGDPASNNLSWQWVASTFSSKPYIFNRENLERYTKGSYCANCVRRKSCPFEKSYDQISGDLFPKAFL